ncbi:hypothetical protein AVEN_189937-1 [Araneus ventricosus]|uniref:Uncharacterized protein n=1 Tax=Araneus ventricosus TaxID=182803 RepID=A0A4Y2F4Z0_ARAVE|nr:hypothetical protein AVEN_189937-1 [Araneus ventricosus]
MPSKSCYPRRPPYLHLPLCSAYQRLQREDLLRGMVLPGFHTSSQHCQSGHMDMADLPMQSPGLRPPHPVEDTTIQPLRDISCLQEGGDELSGLGRRLRPQAHRAQPRQQSGHCHPGQALGVLLQPDEGPGRRGSRPGAGQTRRYGQRDFCGTIHLLALLPCWSMPLGTLYPAAEEICCTTAQWLLEQVFMILAGKK